MVGAVGILSTVGISGYYRRRADRDGGRVAADARGQPSVPARIVAALVLFGGVLLPIVAPGAVSWMLMGLPQWLRVLGLGLVVVSIPLVWWMFRSIGTNVSQSTATREGAELVTHGPYRWIRHPLYAFASVSLLGFGLMLRSWFLLAAVLGIMLWLPVRARREEEYLIASFGDRYRSYMTRTGRFFPRLGKV
jgi:protein-S-isoprenylcysteine O-methyltransferase Ste14